jgi:hypothetical protein
MAHQAKKYDFYEIPNDELPRLGYRRPKWTGEINTIQDSIIGEEHIQERLRERFGKIPKLEFSGPNIILKAEKFVTINIRREDDLWLADNEQLDIHAFGHTTDEAIKEFELLLLHYYEHYKKIGASEALPEAFRLKLLYERKFKEEQV